MPKYKGVYKRKNKKGRYSWYAQYVHNYKKHHIPGSYRTAEEAARARDRFIKRFRSEKSIDKEKITVLEFAKVFLKKYGSRWKESTFIGMESNVRNHIVKILGDRRIGDIDPEDIQEISNHLYKNKLGIRSIYNVLDITKTFFEVAMHWEYIHRNPAYTIELPKLPKSKHPQVDPLRIITMIENIDSLRDKAVIACGFYGLFRIGEALALERKNIDLKLNVIHITQRIYKGELGSPKSASSESSIYMLKPFARIMKEWILQCPPNRWIFPGIHKKDRPMIYETWYRCYFKPICKKYDLNITYHSLRHIGIQFLRNLGISPDYIQSQARHATISTTFDVYSGVSERQILTDRKKIDSSLNKIIENPEYEVLENGK